MVTKTKRPRRESARVKRIRAECERILPTPWPDQAVTEDQQRAAARSLGLSRMLPKRER